MIIRKISSCVLGFVVFFSGIAVSVSSCSEEILDGVKDDEEEKIDVNPGTDRKPYWQTLPEGNSNQNVIRSSLSTTA